MNTAIRPATVADAQAICDIYNPCVRDTIITFEVDELSAADMAARLIEVTSRHPWLVAEVAGRVVGYAYCTRWRTRAAYDQAAETAVYVDSQSQRGGVGAALYQALLAEMEKRNLHAAIGCIALPNEPSVKFHEKCGFVKVGHFPQVGRKFNRWVDVGFWQITL